MQIKFVSKHVPLTPAIEQYSEKKLDKFPRFFDRIQEIELTIDKSRIGYAIEIRTSVEHHDDFIATSEDPDLYACIDLGVDRAIRQLKDHKSKLRDQKHHTSMGGKEMS